MSRTMKRKKGSRKPLTVAEKAEVIQTYFSLGSKTGTAKKLQVTFNTVTKVLKEAEENPKLMAVRSRAYDAVGGKITGTVIDIIDSIQPEHLETEIHRITDKDGNLRRVVTTGPSLRDKAFAAGILTDKIAVMQNARQVAQTPQGGMTDVSLMLPGDIQSSKERVTQLIKNLNFINVTVRDSGVAKRVNALQTKARITDQEVEEAQLVDLSSPDPFD